MCSWLQAGTQYILRISATDTAGITGYADTDPVKVVSQSHSLSPGLVAAIVACTVAVSCGLAALLTVLITQRRHAPRLPSCHPCPGVGT